MSYAKTKVDTSTSDEKKRYSEYWDDAKNILRDQSSQIKIPEFILFSCLVFAQGSILGIPWSQAILIIIGIYGLTKKPVYDLKPVSGLIALFIIMLFYLALVSVNADPTEYASSWSRRLIRMAATVIVILVMASGQIHFKSALLGFLSAITINVPLFYMKLVPDNYGGYLTGLIGDKNVSGLVYCIFAIFAISMVHKLKHKIILFIAFSICLWLTGSRTSIAALCMAMIWIYLAPKVSLLGRFILGLFIYLFVNILSEDYSQAGVFANRTGTDELRERIDSLSRIRVGETPFFGQGLGEAYVDFGDSQFFFHNSYWSAFVEGGWPWAIFTVLVTVFVLIRPFSNRKTWSTQGLLAQGLGVALLICSWRLGEVLFTMYWGICIAYGLRVILIEKAQKNKLLSSFELR